MFRMRKESATWSFICLFKLEFDLVEIIIITRVICMYLLSVWLRNICLAEELNDILFSKHVTLRFFTFSVCMRGHSGMSLPIQTSSLPNMISSIGL